MENTASKGATSAAGLHGILATDNDLLTEREAANLLSIAPGTLAIWRSTGRNALPFVKVGGAVRYSRKALEAWLQARTRSNGATA